MAAASAMWRRVGAAAAALAASAALADPQSKAYSLWTAKGRTVELRYEVARYELTRLPAYRQRPHGASALAEELSAQATVERAGARCDAGAVRSLRAPPGTLRAAMTFHCASDSGGVRIRMRAFLERVPGHLHFASFRSAGGERIDKLLSRGDDALVVPAAGDEGAGRPRRGVDAFQGYLAAGVRHLLAGADHLAFLLGLLLLTRRFLDGVTLVTGFTVGHSVTLGLAALDIVRPDTDAIEALIGFTIALVAAERLCATGRSPRAGALAFGGLFGALALARPALGAGPGALSLLGLAALSACYLSLAARAPSAARVRPALTVAFGMVHGFGFAKALLSVGLPGAERVWALFGFNLGVELGQLLALSALAAAGLALRRWAPAWRSPLSDWLAASLCGLGFYWYFARAF